MVKKFVLPISERIQIFQVWLASINWTLGKNQLTESELEMLSYFIYFNDVYKSIPENDVRMDLLFSTTIKNKIKKEFNISTHKMETYLNKLRKKGIIENNVINEKFIIYPDSSLEITFSCKITSRVESNKVTPIPAKEELPVELPSEPDVNENMENSYDDLDEEATSVEEQYDFKDPFDKYFNNEGDQIESWM
jgi:hypothetical protein